MIAELAHLPDRSDHAEGKDAVLATRKGLVAPNFAPTIFRRQPLEIAVEIIEVLERAVDIRIAQHLTALGETAFVELFIHDSLSLNFDAASHAPTTSISTSTLPRVACE